MIAFSEPDRGDSGLDTGQVLSPTGLRLPFMFVALQPQCVLLLVSRVGEARD